MKRLIITVNVTEACGSQQNDRDGPHHPGGGRGPGGPHNSGGHGRPPYGGEGSHNAVGGHGHSGHRPEHGNHNNNGHRPEHGGWDNPRDHHGHGNRYGHFSSDPRQNYNERVRRARHPNEPSNGAYYDQSMNGMMHHNYMSYGDNEYSQTPEHAYSNYPNEYEDYESRHQMQAYSHEQSYASRETGEYSYGRSEPTPYNSQMHYQNGDPGQMGNYGGENNAYGEPNVFVDPQVPEERSNPQNAGMDPLSAYQAEIARLTRLNEERMRKYEEEKAKYYREHAK
ncbi:unnamed protein product [Rodentolepis nana]|uniref:CCDC50_N domain-containing protein n=1 Tax=Rodentolepis nana TaxID=102285 RepID=A0A0R3T2X7_RODNA|nr:unnamed protein product [Rodentolepis nana]